MDASPNHDLDEVVDIEATELTALEVAPTRPLTDAGNAAVFTAMFGDLVRYDHARRVWKVWDSHRWRPDADSAVYRMALNAARLRFRAANGDGPLDFDGRKKLAGWALTSESTPRLNALLAQARTMVPIADDGREWDTARGLIGVPNGVVDLRTGELRDGRTGDRITMQAGTEYDPAARAPRWQRFLAEIFASEGGEPDKELIRYVQRLAGYSLTGEATLDLAAFLMGVGSNGKTTFLSALRAAAGEYGREVAAVAILDETRAAHSTEVTDLEAARLATCEEVGDRRLNANRFKAITGGGDVTARRMRQDTVTFPVTWMFWLTTNGLPRSDDNSVAFWRRVEVVPFDRQFDPAAEPGLEAELLAELPGILRWAVEGARDWYRDGLGAKPASVLAATTEYRAEIDPLEALFESGALAADPDVWTPTADLYAAYLGWARANLAETAIRMSETTLANRLSARFARARGRVDGRMVRGFRGVRAGRP